MIPCTTPSSLPPPHNKEDSVFACFYFVTCGAWSRVKGRTKTNHDKLIVTLDDKETVKEGGTRKKRVIGSD